MDVLELKRRIKSHPRLKKFALNFIMHPIKARPRWWVRAFQFIYLKTGRGSIIYNSVRKDLVPFNTFILGKNSVIEDFSVVNNAVGPVIIGDNSRVGIGNTVIGPVTIGSLVNIGQHVTITGMNHNYSDINKSIIEQGVSTLPITIEDDVWVGANVVILPGITIGKHSIIGAGSVVTKNVPSYSIAIGNPARVIKKYDFEINEWVKSSKDN